SSRTAVHAGRSDGEEENRAAEIAHDEAVQLAQHVAERNAAAEMGNRFGIDAVSNKGGADAVSGNVAHEKIQVVRVKGADQAEISADCADRVVESLDFEAAPAERLGREALLYTCREREVFFDFLLALFEKLIRGA